jgi:Spy/CpxP family protein refolding chaperone
MEVIKMNKNAVYLMLFGVLCVLAGIVAGAVIVKNTNLSCFGPGKPSFAERAEHFMGRGPKGAKMPKFGRGENPLLEMLTKELDLTGDQQVKVKEILEQTRGEIEKVGKDIRDSIETIRKKGDRQIMVILVPRQQEKFRELLNDFEKRRRPMAGHGPHRQRQE